MIDLQTAAKLLDLGTRIRSEARGREQLEGAVALHDMLSRHRVAYLADEVGMGKTYVALSVVALFRHYDPNFRVLFIAPRENIQDKWIKEFKNFIRHNVKFADLRVKRLDDQPARPLVKCGNLLDLAQEASTDPNRDFFTRMSSFSLPLSKDNEGWKRSREGIQRHLPWVTDDILPLRGNRDTFKDNFARLMCCVLPQFDLVIVDEAHNLKHGYSEHGSSRNRVLGMAMGHPSEKPDEKVFPGYGPRAHRVLFLSATPIEETYRHLWNQLDVFGLTRGFAGLIDGKVSEDEKKRIAAQFLIRRVTAIRSGGEELTKNLYRREWRRGGVYQHDEPLRVQDTRQRLVVALVQKKVSEILQSAQFGASFQIGMLASFESFLETAKVKKETEEQSNFDDADQTEDPHEREGVDADVINQLARDYRERFDNQELPHPKMDAVIDNLANAWMSGKKALVFVRRVASVKELKRKLDDRYDAWLLQLLRERLPIEVQRRFESIVAMYKKEKKDARAKGLDMSGAPGDSGDDRGGYDTFFAWFFRGDGPANVFSGAALQKRFIQQSTRYSTFFQDNHVMALLETRPTHVTSELARVLGMDVDALRLELQQQSAKFLSGKAKRHARADRFEAAQAAAIELLAKRAGPWQAKAKVIWHHRHQHLQQKHATTDAPEIGDFLELPTFFTELRERPDLRARLWPAPTEEDVDKAFREQEHRAQLLAAAARLGHAFIDLYVLTISRLRSLELGTHEDEEGLDGEKARIDAYLDLLAQQMNGATTGQPMFGAYNELSAITAHFDLILDVNDPDARDRAVLETTRAFGSLLREQQPVGGMSGHVNHTLVKQFRMPGYPFVLFTTDLLQEGEDLHTFCSSIHHYGISWTPSAMEQRTGRIDRVRSETDRRLSQREQAPSGEEMLQVYYPHLDDTVEVLQVERVLERMNTFLRLMHEGLSQGNNEQRKIDLAQEMVTGRRYIEPIRERLHSAFPVPTTIKNTTQEQGLAITASVATALRARFEGLRSHRYKKLAISWENKAAPGVLLGKVDLPNGRQQPFALYEQSNGAHLVIRCISPIGRLNLGESEEYVRSSISRLPVRLGAIRGDEQSYNLTVENDVLLGTEATDAARVGLLIQRVVEHADQLEHDHLDGADQPLKSFRTDLEKEQTHGS